MPSKEAEVPRAEIVGSEFNKQIFTDVKECVCYTRKQKRRQRKDFTVARERGESESLLDLNMGDLRKLQQEDETLATIRAAADGESNAAGDGFYRKEGIFYRKWTPPGRDESLEVHQLVLPLQCRRAVLHLAHQIPLAGHLGKSKTADRVRQRFYWPTLFQDVEELCRSCAECQKCAPGRGGPRAPMVPLPIVDELFYRTAMDLCHGADQGIDSF